MALIKCLFLVTMTFTNEAIRPGVIHEHRRLRGSAMGVIYEIGFKSCGRLCIYQKHCEGISYSMKLMQCILMTSIIGSSGDHKYIASNISGWEMDADSCSQRPCAVDEKCLLTKTRYFCAKHLPSQKRSDKLCTPNPCRNGAECYVNQGIRLLGMSPHLWCSCPTPFSSRLCEDVV